MPEIFSETVQRIHTYKSNTSFNLKLDEKFNSFVYSHDSKKSFSFQVLKLNLVVAPTWSICKHIVYVFKLLVTYITRIFNSKSNWLFLWNVILKLLRCFLETGWFLFKLDILEMKVGIFVLLWVKKKKKTGATFWSCPKGWEGISLHYQDNKQVSFLTYFLKHSYSFLVLIKVELSHFKKKKLYKDVFFTLIAKKL